MKLDKRIIIFAVLLAAITTFGIYKYLDSLGAEEREVEYVEVWVAKETIPAKVKVTDAMIDYKEIDRKYIHPEAMTDKNGIVGKYTMERILMDEQILESRLFDLEALRFSYKIPPEKRAMTIQVNLIAGISDMITPGDHIDLLVHIEEREKEGITYPPATKAFIEDVLVLSINKMDSIEEKKAADDAAEEQADNRLLTLAVDTSMTERLFQADMTGQIRIALRHPDADNKIGTNGSITDDFVPLRR
jgi:pilus assembly protein CpaB